MQRGAIQPANCTRCVPGWLRRRDAADTALGLQKRLDRHAPALLQLIVMEVHAAIHQGEERVVHALHGMAG